MKQASFNNFPIIPTIYDFHWGHVYAEPMYCVFLRSNVREPPLRWKAVGVSKREVTQELKAAAAGGGGGGGGGGGR